MASCADCVHVEVCKYFISSLLEGLELDKSDVELINKELNQDDLAECLNGDVCEQFLARDRMAALPCKVGDTVYRLIHGTINEYKVVSINYHVCSTFTDYTITSKHLSAPVNFNFDVNAIGKIVFLSREEAEQALNGACRKCLK